MLVENVFLNANGTLGMYHITVIPPPIQTSENKQAQQAGSKQARQVGNK